MLRAKKSSVSKKMNIGQLKKDLVEDLDQFLLAEEDILNAQKAKEEKKKALAKLDQLIKQELSYNQILKQAKENIREKAQLEDTVEEIKDNHPNTSSGVSRSSHVLDLRPSNKIEKKATFDKYKSGWQKTKEKLAAKRQAKKEKKQTKNTEYHLPKSSGFNWKKYFYIDINLDPWKFKYIGSKIFVFVLVLAVILLPIRALVFFGQLQEDKDKLLQFGKQGLVDLQAGVISASESSYQNAQIDFQDALVNFDQAQRMLDSYQEWMLEAAGSVPVVGKQLSLSRDMLAVAKNISQAGSILNQKIQGNANLTEYLATIHDQVRQTLPYLQSADQDLQKISIKSLPLEMQTHFEGLKMYLPAINKDLQSLDETFSLLVDLLGHEGEKRYLVLFQNDNELRPTGGFIGSFSLLDVYQGKVIGLDTPGGGTYDLDAGQKQVAKAPKALSLINQHFNIWDANWWFDYPTSAKKIESMFESADQTSVDGVIAINSSVLENLLSIIGPIYMEDYQITITADNFSAVLQEEVELNYDKEANTPKAIIADLVPKVLEKLLSGTEKQSALMTSLARQLATKNIQIYVDSPELQNKMKNFGWAGQIADYDKDYLAIISTNIAGGKTDNEIHQAIEHQINIMPNGEIIDTVKLTRANQGQNNNPFAGIDGGNVSYIRFYTPLGSELIEASGFDKIPEAYFRVADSGEEPDPDVAKEEKDMLIDGESNTEIYHSLDRTVFANWMMLKPGEVKTVLLKYKLPNKLSLSDPLVTNWWTKIFKDNLKLDNYNLVIQSQAGAKNTIYNSTIFLPEKYKVVWNNASDKDKMSVNEKIVTYSQNLDRDQYLGFILADKK